MDLFDELWARTWAAELNNSDRYRDAARTWNGAIVLRVRDEDRAIYADLAGGTCSLARVATLDDLATAPFVLTATRRTWDDLMRGAADPLFALITGRLALERGSKQELLPHAAAAKEMIAAARRVGEGALA